MATIFVEIIGNASQFKKELEGAVASTSKANSGFVRMGKVAGVAGLALAGGLAFGLMKSVEAASKFQSEMELVKTQAGASTQEVKNMSKALLALAPAVGATPENLAKGLFHVESAGMRGAKALNVLKLAAEGAAVGHADLEATTNALVGALNAGAKGTGNATHAMGVLNAVIGTGNMRMEDLNSALGTGVLKSAKAFGVSIQDVGAALAEMTRAGIPAVNAATGIKMALASVAGPSAKAIKALSTIGLQSDELAKTMRSHGLIAAMSELTQHMTSAGLNATQQGALIIDVFGRRAATPILALTQHIKGVAKTIDDIKANTNAFGSNWEATQRTAEFATKRFHASIQALAIGVGTALLPAITAITSKLASFMGFLSQHQDLTKGLVIGLTALAAALIAVSVASTIATAAMSPILLPVAAVVVGIAALSFVVYKLVSDFRANWPLLLPIVLGPLGAIIAACIHWHSQIAAVFTAAWNAVKSVTSAAWAGITAVISGALNTVKGVVTSGFNAVVSTIHGAVSAVTAAAHAVATGIINGLKAGLAAIIGVITAAFGRVRAELAGVAGEMFRAAVAIGASIVSGVVSGLSGLASRVGGAIKGGLSSAVHSVGSIFHGSGEYMWTRHAIGHPMVEGIIAGIREREPQLAEQLQRTLAGVTLKATGFSKNLFLDPMKSAKKNMDAWAGTTGVDNLAGVGASFASAFQDGFLGKARQTGVAGFLPAGATTDANAPFEGVISPGGAGGSSPLAQFRGGGDTLNFHFPNYLGSKEEVVQTIRRELLRTQGRNGSLGFK